MGQNINQNIRFRTTDLLQGNYKKLLEGIEKGDLISISKAITIVENKNLNYEEDVLTFLSNLKSKKKSLRIAVSGPPGVGKSTFIEALGMHLLEKGMNVAVLAVDPTSEINRGSILGDKTRMPRLSTAKNAFVRPSSNALELGGIRTSTYDSIRICEAAGFDIVLIETVGVGQSEVDVRKISDLLILLLAPTGGDELQGIKKGIVEMADFILINKADSGLEKLAERALKEYKSAIHFSANKKSILNEVKLKTISSLNEKGISSLVNELLTLKKDTDLYQKILINRSIQEKSWFAAKADQLMLHLIKKNRKSTEALKKASGEKDLYTALLSLSENLSKFI